VYSLDEVDRALALYAELGSFKAVSRETGISRAAIRSWALGLRPGERERRRTTCFRCGGSCFPVPNATAHAYSYLLGLYLGDGTISTHPREVYRLRVFLDRKYPIIVGECEAAMAIVMPASRVGRFRSKQYRVDEHPGRFLRALIHSDGSRSINTIRHPKKTYRYPRYEFSNRSDDIRALFCEYCDKVGVDWRRMNRWTISVARRESVALMDRHIGPKR